MRAAQRKRVERVKALLKACEVADSELVVEGRSALGIAREKAADGSRGGEARER